MKIQFFAPLIGFFYYLIRDQNGPLKDALYSLRHLPQKLKGQKCDAFVSNFGQKPLIYLLDQSLIGEFLQQPPHVYKKTDIATAMSKQLFGGGIIFAENDEWKSKRKMLSNIFHFQLISDQIKLVQNVTQTAFDSLDLNNPVTFMTLIEKIGGDVGLMSFLGADVNKYKLFGQEPNLGINKFMEGFLKYSSNLITIFAGQFFYKNQIRSSDRLMCEQTKEIKRLIRQIVVDRIDQTKLEINNSKEELKQTTIISLLLEKGLLQNEQEINELSEMTLNFYFAAKDTVSRTLANLFYFIAKNKSVYDELEQEILTLKDENITLDNLKKYTFLDATIKETLRYAGPSPFLIQRTALIDHHLGKYNIKKGTEMNCNFMYNFYNDEYFENPMEFNPKRWIEDNRQQEKLRLNPFAFLPFSGGSRNCIGQYFAQMEMKVIVILFIRKFQQFTIPNDFVYHIVLKSTVETKDHLTCQLTKRII